MAFGLWRVCVYARESHTNPSWDTNVRAPTAAMAVICAMTHHQYAIGKITVEPFDGYGSVTADWTDD